MFQWVFDEIFSRARPNLWTVPVYAILDLGFDVKFRDNPGTAPAGIQVRRAHRRPLNGVELPVAGTDLELLKFEIEMLLRHYGITSANPGTCIDVEEHDGRLEVRYGGIPITTYSQEQLRAIPDLNRAKDGPLRFAGVNIQLTRESRYKPLQAQLVDFGPYVVRERFTDPVLSLALGRNLCWSRALWPDAPHFVQPFPSLRLPMDDWVREADWEEIEPLHLRPAGLASRMRILGYHLARRFRAGELSPKALLGRLRELVAATSAGWPDEAT